MKTVRTIDPNSSTYSPTSTSTVHSSNSIISSSIINNNNNNSNSNKSAALSSNVDTSVSLLDMDDDYMGHGNSNSSSNNNRTIETSPSVERNVTVVGGDALFEGMSVGEYLSFAYRIPYHGAFILLNETIVI